jgi:arylsulfatase A-like enzyme
LFSEAGFETLGVSAMANVSSPLGFARGFDTFVELYKSESVKEQRRQTTPEQEKVPEEDEEVIAYPRAADINEVVIPWLSDRTDEDCFVLVWAIDPHDPYDPPPEFEMHLDEGYSGPSSLGRERGSISEASNDADFQRLRDLYDGEITYMDDRIGELTSFLRTEGCYEETLFAFTGDHGESFGDRRWHGDYVATHNTPPFDERLHVPLVIKPPAGTDIGPPQGLCESVDIAPTLLRCAGLAPDPMQGDVLSSGHDKDVVYSQTQQERSHAKYYSIRTDRWKYVRMDRPEPRLRNVIDHPRHFVEHWLADRELLYDLEADPLELDPSITDDAVKTELADRLTSWLERTETAGETISRVGSGDDESIERQLEALGYLE